MYNFSVKRYPNGGSQIKIYKKAIRDNPYTFDCSLEDMFESVYKKILSTSTNKKKLIKSRDILNRIEHNKVLALSGFDDFVHCPDSDCPFDVEPISKIPNLRKLNDNNKRDKQLVYDLARSNYWDWFVTVTFNPNKYNRQNYDECCKSLSNMLNNIRKRYSPDLKYLFVPELHSDNVSWHFHGLLANCSELEFTRAINGNIDSKFYGLPLVDNNGNEVYVNKQFSKLGNCTFTRVRDSRRVSSYITKYITKSTNAHLFGKNRHIASRNLNRPTVSNYMLNIDDMSTLYECITPLWETERTFCVGKPYQNTIKYLEVDSNTTDMLLGSI